MNDNLFKLDVVSKTTRISDTPNITIKTLIVEGDGIKLYLVDEVGKRLTDSKGNTVYLPIEAFTNSLYKTGIYKYIKGALTGTIVMYDYVAADSEEYILVPLFKGMRVKGYLYHDVFIINEVKYPHLLLNWKDVNSGKLLRLVNHGQNNRDT